MTTSTLVISALIGFQAQAAPIPGLLDGAKLATDFNAAMNEARLLFLFSPS